MAPAAQVARISAAAAAEALAGFEALDPRGISSAGDVLEACERGECFALTGPTVNAVYVVNVKNGVCWVQAVKGGGESGSVLPVIDAVISAQAAGAREIAFQTKRPGLRRQLERRGFRVAGWIMKRTLDHVVRL